MDPDLKAAMHERVVWPLPPGEQLDQEVSAAFGLKRRYPWSTSVRAAESALNELARRRYHAQIWISEAVDPSSKYSIKVEQTLARGDIRSWRISAPDFALVIARIVSLIAMEGPLMPRT